MKAKRMSKSASSKKRLLLIVSIPILLLLITTSLFWMLTSRKKTNAVLEAAHALNKGLAALAAEKIEPYRLQLTSNQNHCNLIVSIYITAQRPNLLAWASEACINSGFDTPEVYIGLATSRETQKNLSSALQIVDSGIQKYKTSQQLYIKKAKILDELHRYDEAIHWYKFASDLDLNNMTIAYLAFQYTEEKRRYAEALQLEDRLIKNNTMNTPELFFLLARCHQQKGSFEKYKIYTKRAKLALEKIEPVLLSYFYRKFPDILGGSDKPPITIDRFPTKR